jgi:hypothetical protein
MKKFVWEITTQADHLVALVSGTWNVKGVLEMVDDIARTCRATGHSRVLCDLRQMRGNIAEMEKYMVGVRIAEAGQSIRFAALAAADTTVTHFAGRVAAKRGGSLLTTKDEQEALEWLRG